MKTILSPSSSKLPMPNVNSIITNLKQVRMVDDQKDPSFFKCKIPAIVKDHFIIIAEKCMSRILEDQNKVCNMYININTYVSYIFLFFILIHRLH